MFIFQADTYCDRCGEEIASRLPRPEGDLWDSGDYPIKVSVDPADTPQHCAVCGEFLENPLTQDGEEYVKAMDPVPDEYREFYSYLFED